MINGIANAKRVGMFSGVKIETTSGFKDGENLSHLLENHSPPIDIVIVVNHVESAHKLPSTITERFLCVNLHPSIILSRTGSPESSNRGFTIHLLTTEDPRGIRSHIVAKNRFGTRIFGTIHHTFVEQYSV